MTSQRQTSTGAILSGLFLLSVVLLAVTKIGDTDAWMHLSLGKLIWTSKGFPAKEVFVYPSLDLPFNYSSWLFGVLYYLAYQAMHIYGVILLKAATVTAAMYILFRDSIRPVRNDVVSLLVLMAAVVMMRHRFVERPDTFAMLFLSFNIYCLNTLVYENRKRPLFLLPITNLLWANSHSSVVLMFIPFASFIVGGAIEHVLVKRGRVIPHAPSPSHLRAAAVAMALSFAASLISPYFLSQYFFGSDMLADPFIKQQIIELRPPTWSWTKAPYLMAAAVACSFALTWRRFPVTQALLVIPFLILPFTAIRFLVLLGVVGGPVLARNLSVWIEDHSWRRMFTGSTAAAVTAVLIIACTALALFNAFPVLGMKLVPGFGIADGTIPEGALAFMDRHKTTGRVFNAFEFGGYIAWRDFPERSVFVDPRGYLAPALLERHALARRSSSQLDALEREYGFESLLFSYPITPRGQTGVLEESLEYWTMHPQWALVYWDDVSLLYLKRGGTYDAVVRAFEYRRVNPERAIRNTQFITEQSREETIRELERNVRETGSARAQLRLAFAYHEAGRHQEAVTLFRTALEHPLTDRFEAYRGLAASLHELGSDDQALEYISKALSLYEDASLHTNAGMWLLKSSDRRSALRHLEKALDLNPNLASLYPLVIGLCGELGMPEKAVVMGSRQAAAARASAGEEHFRDGLRAYADRQYDLAIEAFSRSVKANPSNPSPYSNLGYVYYDKGMMDRAFEYQRKAIEIDPNHANAYYGLALVYKNQGNLPAAKQQWERYLQLEPAGYFSRRAREQIKVMAPD